MLVRNNALCMHYCGPEAFKPGMNEKSADQVAYLLTDASFKARCDAKVFDVIGEAGEVVKNVVAKVVEVSIQNMKPAAAIKAVKGILDREKLIELKVVEVRPAVLAEIEKQLTMLNTNDEKPKDE